jgi:hypothetical protein
VAGGKSNKQRQQCSVVELLGAGERSPRSVKNPRKDSHAKGGSSQPCCLRETGAHRDRSGPLLEKIAAGSAEFGKRMRHGRAEVQFGILALSCTSTRALKPQSVLAKHVVHSSPNTLPAPRNRVCRGRMLCIISRGCRSRGRHCQIVDSLTRGRERRRNESSEVRPSMKSNAERGAR